MAKAPLGGEKTGPNPTDRGKLGVKRSVLTDARGTPIGAVIAGANRNDHLLKGDTLDSLGIARLRPTQHRQQHLCLDKGYDYAEPRRLPKASASPFICVHGARRSRPSAMGRARPGAGSSRQPTLGPTAFATF